MMKQSSHAGLFALTIAAATLSSAAGAAPGEARVPTHAKREEGAICRAPSRDPADAVCLAPSGMFRSPYLDPGLRRHMGSRVFPLPSEGPAPWPLACSADDETIRKIDGQPS